MRDLNAEARAKRREEKPVACLHPHWLTGKSRYDKCSLCRTSFPCRGECSHLDCSEERIKRGIDFDYQDGCYDHAGAVTYEDGVGRVLFESDPA